jgi:hypothetical protein
MHLSINLLATPERYGRVVAESEDSASLKPNPATGHDYKQVLLTSIKEHTSSYRIPQGLMDLRLQRRVFALSIR